MPASAGMTIFFYTCVVGVDFQEYEVDQECGNHYDFRQTVVDVMSIALSTTRLIKGSRLAIVCCLCLFHAGLQAANPVTASGFLEHYAALKPDPDFEGAFIWENPKADLKHYDKLMVAPVEVWMAPDSEYKGLSADQVALLNQSFHELLAEVMEPDYPLVSKPGEGVLVLRVAMTNVNARKKKKTFASWLPTSLIITGIDAAYFGSLGQLELASAQLEGETRDAITNQLVATRVVTGVGPEGDELHFQGFIDFLRYRVEQFRSAMDKARNRH